MARLGDVCSIYAGTGFPIQYQGNSEGQYPFYKVGDISRNATAGNKILSLCDNYIDFDVVKAIKGTVIPAGTVVFAKIGEAIKLNRRAITSCECLIDNNAMGIRPHVQHVLLDYFFHFICNVRMETLAEATTVPSIKKSIIEKIEIPVPTLKEQQRIATELNHVDNLLSLRKQQLAKLDELVKARFVEMFGDTGKQVLLTDYVWFQEGPGVRSVDFTDEGTILLTGSNINDNTISFGYKSDRHISNELASGKYAHFMCDKDDILVVSSAIDPEKFDKKVVVVGVDKKYCLNTGIIRFKPNKQYLTLGYFREFLKTDYFKHQVSSEMRGIAQMHFGPSHLKQMTILLPDSIERQVEFEAFVQQIDKSKLSVQQSIDQLETLKKSLMQKYFG